MERDMSRGSLPPDFFYVSEIRERHCSYVRYCIQVVTRWGGNIKKLGFGHSSWGGETQRRLKGEKEGDGMGVCSAGAGK